MSLLWPEIKRTFLSAVCLAAGLALAIGGIWLIAVGGSLYYALAGFAYLLIGGLLYRCNAWAYWAYATLNLATLIWAVFEVGLDWWQLMPRGNFIVPFGLIMAVPAIARGFGKSARDPVFTSGQCRSCWISVVVRRSRAL
jgi:quinoprotein glucose dehydrogenase